MPELFMMNAVKSLFAMPTEAVLSSSALHAIAAGIEGFLDGRERLNNTSHIQAAY